MAGGCVSTTVTVCVAMLVLPWTSVTIHVTVVTPFGNEAGASFVTLATPQLSPVVGVPSATLAAAAEHLPRSAGAVTLAGAAIVGISVSRTTMTCDAVVVLP